MWDGLAEIGDPVVVSPAEGGEKRAVGNAIPEEALARLQAGGPHAVGFQLFQHRVGLVSGLPDVFPDTQKVDRRRIFEPLTGLDHRSDGANPGPVEVPGVVHPARTRAVPFHAGRTAAEFWLDASLVQIRGLDDVRIGRDQLVSGHGRPPDGKLRPRWFRRPELCARAPLPSIRGQAYADPRLRL